MKTKKIAVCASLAALSAVLSLIKIFEFPFGGSITAASMAPILIVGILYGTKTGIMSAFTFSITQLALGVATGIVSRMFLPGNEHLPFSSAIIICLLDYVLAFTVLGLSGVFGNKLKTPGAEPLLGAAFACFLRYAVHTLSGFIFYGAWAGWFFGEDSGLSQISFLKPFCAAVLSRFNGNSLALLYSAIYNAAYMLPETLLALLLIPLILKAVKNVK